MGDPTQAADAVNKPAPAPGRVESRPRAKPDRAFAFPNWLRLVGHILVRFRTDRCTQAAASLTYTTLLSLVPLMTITLGILSAFPAFQDVRGSLQSIVFDTLVPQVGSAVMDHVQAFIDRAASLTGVGVVGLIVTSVLLLMTIEGAFNTIWRVHTGRSLIIRLLSFWALLTVTPLLFAVSLTLTDRLLGGDLDTAAAPWRQIMALMPLLVEWLGFTLIFRIIPARSVRLHDAAIGGLVAAVLFEICKIGFALYLQFFPLYETIYGAISTIPIFLIWLYVAWSVVLIGAVTAAALPDWRAQKGHQHGADALDAADRLLLAAWVLRHLGANQADGATTTRDSLFKHLPVPLTALDSMLDDLERAGLIIRTMDEHWVLRRSLDATTIGDIAQIAGLWSPATLAGPDRITGQPDDPLAGQMAAVLDRLAAKQADGLSTPLAGILGIRRGVRGVDGPANDPDGPSCDSPRVDLAAGPAQ